MNDVKTKEREINGLIEAMNTYDLDQGFILTHTETGEEDIKVDGKTYNIIIKPVCEWLLL